MIRFLKEGTIFVIIIACALSIVNSSSGVSQFQSNRGVAMKVVNSEEAFISLPEVINLDITVSRQIINYYKWSTIYVSEKMENNIKPAENENPIEALETTEPSKIVENAGAIENIEAAKTEEVKIPIEIKEFVKTEESIEISDVSNTFKIKNNMGDAIELVKIDFGNPKLQANGGGLSLGAGAEKEIEITHSYNGKELVNFDDLADNEQVKSGAALHFIWDKGQSILYKDVILNVTVNTLEPIEQIIE